MASFRWLWYIDDIFGAVYRDFTGSFSFEHALSSVYAYCFSLKLYRLNLLATHTTSKMHATNFDEARYEVDLDVYSRINGGERSSKS